MADSQKYWFAARTRANQEISLRESLKKIDITCYLPTQIVARRTTDRIKKVEIPVICNLIFLKTTKDNAFALVKERALKLSYLKDRETGSLLVVPDKQMEDFMFVMNLSPEMGIYNNEELVKGDRVRIVKGDFAGVEGELVRVNGKTHVVVRIPQVMAIGVKVSRGWLERID